MMKSFNIILFGLMTVSAAAQQVVPGIIIAKVKPEFKTEIQRDGLQQSLIKDLATADQFLNLKRNHPHAETPDGRKSRNGTPFIDLTRTYRFTTTAELDLDLAIRELTETQLFEFVETTTYSGILYTPNDPLHTSQNHLVQSMILAAWDSTLGDTNVVIGITDTSMDLLHEDLQGNIKRNYADPIDGIDNDNDGYTDNFEGWDMDGNDNDLFFTNDFHGTSVAILSSATPDNNIGVTGSGFNCKFLPIKVSTDGTAPNIVTSTGHDGITYAVEHGATVVNCSWGTTTWSQAGQDVVDYATINFDAVVVASCGNVASETAYYPASFTNVISVTGVHGDDVFDDGISPTFTYHDSVDIAALGFDVYSSGSLGAPGTNPIYTTSGGTSLAAPIVSGVVGLIRSKLPCLDAFDVMQLLVDSADVIDGIAQNMPYAGKIGKRLNAMAALQANLCTLTTVPQLSGHHISLYPNPAQTAFRWDDGGNRNIQRVYIYDASGKLILNKAVSSQVRWIDVSDLPNGMYQVRMMGKESIATERLVIGR